MGLLWQKALLVALCAGSVLTSRQAFAWGSIGHAMVGRVAAEQAAVAKDFWAANSTSVEKLSNVPDAYWKKADTFAREETNHWFQIDGYMDPSQFIPDLFLSYAKTVDQYSRDHVTENGTSSWRSEQMYNMAVDAFKHNNFKGGLEIVGALSHYIGDMSQPLHLTSNYDGQMSEQRGIHKYFETLILQKENHNQLQARVADRTRALLADPSFRKQLDGNSELKISYLEGMRAVKKLDNILDIDREHGRNNQAAKKQMEIVVERLADGAATLAYLLGQIAKEANLENKSTQIKTTIPVWIPSEFQGTPGLGERALVADDCLN